MAAAGFWLRVRASALATRHARARHRRRGAGRLLGAALFLVALAFPVRGFAADEVPAEATFSSGGGFARLVIKFNEDVGSEVVTAGSIIVIRFERPVDVSVDKVAESVPDYIGAARRDPDGSAIRLSLSRKVTINTMTAGERLFVDLLPESWKGPPPSLPNEVVRELSERARAAERELRQQRAMSEAKKRAPVRVRASVQPTFVRFIFEMPDGVGVSSVLNEQKLKLLFSKALTFDLADAKLASPPNVASISQKIEGETAVVELVMLGDVDVHSFREDKNYVIDVAYQPPDKASVLPQVSDAARAAARAAEKAVASAALRRSRCRLSPRYRRCRRCRLRPKSLSWPKNPLSPKGQPRLRRNSSLPRQRLPLRRLLNPAPSLRRRSLSRHKPQCHRRRQPKRRQWRPRLR